MTSKNANVGFISELDQFLAELAQRYPVPSNSQRDEIARTSRIARLRDDPATSQNQPPLWEKF